MVTQEEEDDARERLSQTQVWINGTKPLYMSYFTSQNNLISERTVQRLRLETQSHPKPYKLNWLQPNQSHQVQRQRKVELYIEPMMDEVLCDVVPLDACELLLGKPYIYGRDAQYKVFPHEFRLKKGGKTFVLKESLPPKEALAIVSAKQAGKCIKQTGAYALFIVRPQAPSQ
jgi:hypothetical protein